MVQKQLVWQVAGGIIVSSRKTIIFSRNNFNFVIEQLIKIIVKENFTHIIIGFPKNMNNTIGPQARIVKKFAKQLKLKIKENINKNNIILKLVDERLTTKIANQIMIEANLSRKKRKRKKDSLAAQLILETYLSMIKNK